MLKFSESKEFLMKTRLGSVIRRYSKSSLFILVCITIFSCNKKESVPSIEEKRKVHAIATIAQIGDLVQEVGGERAEVAVLIHGSLDPHSYEMVKGDDEKLQGADLIFYNGLGLEHGASLSEILRSSDTAIAVGEKISERRPQEILKREGIVDPHLWMDISLWSEALEPIAEAFSEIDPEGASYYQERASQMKERMLGVDREVYRITHQIPSKRRYLVTSHDAFHYFARRYLADEGEELWTERFEAPEGLSPDGQLGSADIRRIVDYLKNHDISVLFPESNVSLDSIQKIAYVGKKIGLDVRVCKETLYGDAMDGENLHYLDMMQHNATVIARYLEADG